MPRVARPANAASPRPRHVEDVGHDAHRRRQVARAAPREQRWTERPPFEGDRVEHAVDVGEGRVARDERGVHAELDALAAVAPDGQVLDDEAEALGEAVVDRIDPANALGRDRARLDARAEGEHREDHQLVRRVVSVDVEAGIRLGVALAPAPRARPRRSPSPSLRIRVRT